MAKYISSIFAAIATMCFEYGSPTNWTFQNFITSFLVAFFVVYHLGLLKAKINN